MKNKYYKVLLFIPILAILGCSKENDTGSDLIISEFHSLTATSEKVIELYNRSNKTLDLSKYHIEIQNSMGNRTINLSGSLESDKTFVIARDCATVSKFNADLVSSQLIWNGTQYLTLRKGKKIMDAIGSDTIQYEYGTYLDMCRKKEYLIGRYTYRPYDWIRYAPDNLSRLHTINGVLSDEELLEGPHLTGDDFAKEFTLDGEIGNGGVMEVTLGSMGDGDTTRFNFGYTNSYVHGNNSVRYIALDTPEIQHGSYIDEMPWGEAAKEFNNDILSRAKSYAVQSVPNYTLYETYGRILGYVWVSFIDNPQPQDYELLNFLLVKEGYSTLRFVKGNQKYDITNYKGISYQNYMYNAELIAIENKLRVHGSSDPNFDA
mgnify:CR=1 FL=1